MLKSLWALTPPSSSGLSSCTAVFFLKEDREGIPGRATAASGAEENRLCTRGHYEKPKQTAYRLPLGVPTPKLLPSISYLPPEDTVCKELMHAL